MPRRRGRRADPRVTERRARLVEYMYEALGTPHGLVISSLTPASDLAYCRELTKNPLHPQLANITVRRNPEEPDEIHLARNDA